jgi:tellurite resistance protein TehA-like permease
MLLALAAYATYVVNAGQFIWKLRMARLDEAKKKLAATTHNPAMASVQALVPRSPAATLTGLTVAEAEELHRNLIQGTQIFGFTAAIAHLLAYIYSPWLK